MNDHRQPTILRSCRSILIQGYLNAGLAYWLAAFRVALVVAARCIDGAATFRTRGRLRPSAVTVWIQEAASRPFVGVRVDAGDAIGPSALWEATRGWYETGARRPYRRGGAAYGDHLYHIQLRHVAQHAGNDPSKWREMRSSNISQESAIATATAGVITRDGH